MVAAAALLEAVSHVAQVVRADAEASATPSTLLAADCDVAVLARRTPALLNPSSRPKTNVPIDVPLGHEVGGTAPSVVQIATSPAGAEEENNKEGMPVSPFTTNGY